MNKKKKTLFLIFLVLIGSLAALSCKSKPKEIPFPGFIMGSQSKTLQFQCTVNSTEQIETNLFSTVLTQISGTAVLESKQGACTFTLKSTTVKIAAGDVDFTYDSSVTYTDEKDLLRNIPYNILLEKPIVLYFDKDGYITNVEGYEAVLSALNQQMEPYGRETAEQVKNTFDEHFDLDTMRFILERVTGHMPEGPVGQGASFTRQSYWVLPYACSLDSAFRYTGLLDNAYTFELTGNVLADGEYDGIVYDLQGTTTGKTKLYENSGKGSLYREGHEQSSFEGTESFELDGETKQRNLSVIFSLQYSLLNN